MNFCNRFIFNRSTNFFFWLTNFKLIMFLADFSWLLTIVSGPLGINKTIFNIHCVFYHIVFNFIDNNIEYKKYYKIFILCALPLFEHNNTYITCFYYLSINFYIWFLEPVLRPELILKRNNDLFAFYGHNNVESGDDPKIILWSSWTFISLRI